MLVRLFCQTASVQSHLLHHLRVDQVSPTTSDSPAGTLFHLFAYVGVVAKAPQKQPTQHVLRRNRQVTQGADGQQRGSLLVHQFGSLAL